MSYLDAAVVDLSHYNAAPDFAAAKSGGLLGVIHKATEGLDFVDPTRALRRTQALAAGLLWGDYHFLTSAASGADQAARFLEVVGPQPGELLALDFEGNGTCSATLAAAREFVTAVFNHVGKWPVLYAGGYLKGLLAGSAQATAGVLTNCPLWLAEYGAAANLPAGWTRWALWQYSDGTTNAPAEEVPGIGRCDRDRFDGDEAALRTFWASVSA